MDDGDVAFRCDCIGLCLICGPPGVGKTALLDIIAAHETNRVSSFLKLDDMYGRCAGSGVDAVTFSPEVWHNAQRMLYHRCREELEKRIVASLTGAACQGPQRASPVTSWVFVEDNFHLASMRKRYKSLFQSVLQRLLIPRKDGKGYMCDGAPRAVMAEVLVTAPDAMVHTRNESRAHPVPRLVVSKAIEYVSVDGDWSGLLRHFQDLQANGHKSLFLSQALPVDVPRLSRNSDEGPPRVATFDELPFRSVVFNGTNEAALLPVERSLQVLADNLTSWLGALCKLHRLWLPRAATDASADPSTYDTPLHRLDLNVRAAVANLMRTMHFSSREERTRTAVYITNAKRCLLASARQQLSHTVNCGGRTVADITCPSSCNSLDQSDLERMLVDLVLRQGA